MLLGCQGGGDIAQDAGEAIGDKRSWGRVCGGKVRGYRPGESASADPMSYLLCYQRASLPIFHKSI